MDLAVSNDRPNITMQWKDAFFCSTAQSRATTRNAIYKVPFSSLKFFVRQIEMSVFGFFSAPEHARGKYKTDQGQ